MEYHLLGKSALRVSEIGFGCMSLKSGAAESMQVIDAAIDGGINYFDSADIYDDGDNERLLGKAIRGKRADLIIASKVGNVRRADGSGLDWNPRRAHILAGVEASLTRLGTDYIDLYQLHGGTIDDDIDETIAAFETLVQQGKIRYYGISSIRPNVIKDYAHRSNIVSVMMQYSLLDRRPEEAMLALLLDRGIGVLARGTIASGLLTGKPPKEYLGMDAATVKEVARLVTQFSDEQRPPLATATRFVLSHPAITSAVIGIRTKEQLAGALAIPASRPLSHGSLNALQERVMAAKYTQHR